MDRETMNEALSKVLNREATRDEISTMMNLFNDNLKKGVAEATQKTTDDLNKSFEQKLNEAKSKWEADSSKKYESYKSADEYNDILNQLNTLKDEKAQNERYEKYRNAGIKERLFKSFEAEFGTEHEDFDKDLEEFVKDTKNADFLNLTTEVHKNDYGKRGNPATLPEGITQEMLDKSPALRAKYAK